MQVLPENLQSNKLQLITLVVVLVLFAFSLFFGISSGISQAQSNVTFKNASQVYNALQFYFHDQDVYPRPSDFGTLNPYYISAIPAPSDANGSCSAYNQFVYNQMSPKNFSLSFCLTKAAGGFSAGVHTLTDQGSQ